MDPYEYEAAQGRAVVEGKICPVHVRLHGGLPRWRLHVRLHGGLPSVQFLIGGDYTSPYAGDYLVEITRHRTGDYLVGLQYTSVVPAKVCSVDCRPSQGLQNPPFLVYNTTTSTVWGSFPIPRIYLQHSPPPFLVQHTTTPSTIPPPSHARRQTVGGGRGGRRFPRPVPTNDKKNRDARVFENPITVARLSGAQGDGVAESHGHPAIQFLQLGNDKKAAFTPLRFSPTFGIQKKSYVAQCRFLASRRVVETSLGGVSLGGVSWEGWLWTSILFEWSVSPHCGLDWTTSPPALSRWTWLAERVGGCCCIVWGGW